MPAKQLSQFEALFECPAGLTTGEDLLFLRMSAVEELGRLPQYTLELLRDKDKAPVAPNRVLGKTAAVKIRLADGGYRYVHGIVTHFYRGGSRGRYKTYHAEMRPWLWYLTLGADCRIFQDMTAVAIIKKVFGDYTSNVNFEDKLSGSFRSRPFTVQYRETDFEFVQRLMEEEGIYYYFKHEAGKHTMRLCNGPTGHEAISPATLLWSDAVKEETLRDDIITEWQLMHQVGSLKYAHTDFAAESPTTSLLKSASRTLPYPAPGDLEVFDYPGGYEDLAMKDGSTSAKATEAARLAALRVDAFESRHSEANGETPTRVLGAGWKFTFAKHDHDNGGYLVTATDFTVEYDGYEANFDDGTLECACSFRAVPDATKFQPRPMQTRPLIAGPQTAVVVGPSGDEIHTDKYGRVKVKFHWDRVGKSDETASCWVRVSQPWAGRGFGAMAIPRIGDEVVVEFLEGNPDRPLITGRVYNADNMPPWTLPAQAAVSGVRTRSTKKGGDTDFNELRFDDVKGSEYVWFQAQKDFHHWVKNNATVTIKGLRKQQIEKDDQLKVTGKYDGEIGKAVTLKIGTDVHAGIGGDVIFKIGGATGLAITGDTKLKGTGNIKVTGEAALEVTAASAVKINSDGSLHIKATSGIMIDGGTQLAIKAGAGFIVLDASGVSIVGPMVKINSGGSATPAQKALKTTVPAAKEPPAPPEHKDPLGN